MWAVGLPPFIWGEEHSAQAHTGIQWVASNSSKKGGHYKRYCESTALRISAVRLIPRSLFRPHGQHWLTKYISIDDIQDSSKLRRGKPVAHSIFGVAQTINSANYAYFLAQQKLSSWYSTRANDVFIEELLNLHRGQGMELHWRDTLTCPTEEEYIDMVLDKTGGLFRLAVKLMQLESNQKWYAGFTLNAIYRHG